MSDDGGGAGTEGPRQPPDGGVTTTDGGVTTEGCDRSKASSLIDALVSPRPEPARHGTPPDRPTLRRILEAATTVPYHGGLQPWRFAVVMGAGQERFGEALVAGQFQLRGPDQPESAVAKMRAKAHAAPCAVVLIASPRPSNVPEWEQVASAACTGYAIVLAAAALGLGAVWKSAAVLEADAVRELFDLSPTERLLGWVNLGSSAGPRRAGRSQPTSSVETVHLGGLVTVLGEGFGAFAG